MKAFMTQTKGEIKTMSVKFTIDKRDEKKTKFNFLN